MNSQKLENSQPNVIPANPGSVSGAGAGIQKNRVAANALDPGVRGDEFSRGCQRWCSRKKSEIRQQRHTGEPRIGVRVNNVMPAKAGIQKYRVVANATGPRRFGVTNFQEAVNDDALVKSPKFVNNVIPANPGSVSGVTTTSCRRKPASRNIVWLQTHWTPGVRGDEFSRGCQRWCSLVKSPKFVNNVIPANPGSVSGGRRRCPEISCGCKRTGPPAFAGVTTFYAFVKKGFVILGGRFGRSEPLRREVM